MNVRFLKLARDALILAALIVLATLIGQIVGNAWKKSQELPPVQSFDAQLLSLEGLVSPVMIASSTCPACAKARTWLAQHHVAYRELTVDTSEPAKHIADRLNVTMVPTFLIGDIRINGFVEDELAKRLTSGKIAM